ncbi:C-type lectin galactose-binding isoform-like [Pantherophis guttatus]|uniref:C-type lectin galactose-binding isoform-like n=1 Tax=Pantherophis guttatus TaxID=94885 RepID=A0ABM3ZA41_PANGU|nr:C-type lectin galactose-binding isoform-like [Pantherophis guttatus]
MGRFIFVTLGLLVVAFSIHGAEDCCCPRDWLPMNGFCYKVFEERKNWKDAETFCRKQKPGCHLASIHSMDQGADLGDYITDYLTKKDRVWIGLYDPWKNYVWEWTDRSRTDYLPWKTNQPDHFQNKEFCVEIVDFTGYLQWNDQGCTVLRPFLCQCKY